MTKYFEYGEKELNHLRKNDKVLGAAIDQIGTIKRALNPDPFSALIESIISQQISGKAAATVCARLNKLLNELSNPCGIKTATNTGIKAAKLHALTAEEIQSVGMSMRKAAYIKNIALAAVDNTIDFDKLHEKTDQEIIKTLTAIKGVGIWTVEMLLIFSLMRPDVVSFGDLAIRRGMMNLYNLKELPKEQFQKYAKRYSPYGSVASLYLWELSDF